MSMWKNIKSLFVVEEETAPQEEKAPEVAPAQPKVEPVSRPEGAGKVTGKFTEVLLRAMSEHNIEGFDYLEYKKSLNSLKEMPMDEPTRYQSAFAMAQTMGTTPQHLIQTAQHYVEVLRKEEQKFQEALANQKKLQIESKEQALSKLDETIKSKVEKIRQLTQEIEAHQKAKVELNQEIESAAAKVEATKLDFIASYQSLSKQIQKDVDNMKQYLSIK
ncbi:MAG: hypothetical protein H6573_17610 [Lewinellaceae bacterium]|nr:hypothetical protein [Phaeodactylibacter sp.]MCB0615046.1 hypothetical protein [Phaeodactylibacter sp.]MCB9349307.1 hypothetical protein [Lewinellaceae bacterium]